MASINKSIWTTYFTDDEGNIVSVRQIDEEVQISPINYTVQLKYIPEEFNRVVCLKKNGEVMHEVNDISSLDQDCFCVDYNTGKCTFSSKNGGEIGIFNYYGLGYELISCARVFDQNSLEGDSTVKTLQDIIDAGREGIEYLETIGDATILIGQLQAQVSNASTVETNLTNTINTGNDLKTDLEEKIETGTGLNTNLDTTIPIANTAKTNLDSSISTADTELTVLNSAITTATNTNTTLTNTKNSAQTVNTNLTNNIEIGNQLIEEIEQTVNTNGVSSIANNVANLLNYSVVVGSLAELKTAISNVGKAGYSNRIFIKGGTYTPTESYELPSFTYISALGDGEVIFKCNSSSINNLFRTKCTSSTMAYNGAKYVTIEGITIDGNNTVNTISPIGLGHASNCYVKNCTFKNFNNWHNIEINGSENIYVQYCNFSNYGNTSGGNPTEVIQLDYMGGSEQYPWTSNYDGTACRNIFIENCTFDNISASCIGNHMYGTISNNIHIQDNVFRNCEDCISLGDVNNLHIYNNTAESVKFFVRMYGGAITQTLYDWNICNNVVSGKLGETGYETYDNENRFIVLEANSNKQVVNRVSVINNTIKKMNGHAVGITCNMLTILNNEFIDIGRDAIYFYGGNIGKISGNTMYNIGTYGISYRDLGIAVGGNAEMLTKNVLIHDNDCKSICILENAMNINTHDNVGTYEAKSTYQVVEHNNQNWS
jgi:hypothetical protein